MDFTFRKINYSIDKECFKMVSKEEKNYKNPKISKVWNFLIYGSTIAIGVFLIWLYSAYIFINK